MFEWHFRLRVIDLSTVWNRHFICNWVVIKVVDFVVCQIHRGGHSGDGRCDIRGLLRGWLHCPCFGSWLHGALWAQLSQWVAQTHTHTHNSYMLIKVTVYPNWTFCYHFLTLIQFQTCMTYLGLNLILRQNGCHVTRDVQRVPQGQGLKCKIGAM